MLLETKALLARRDEALQQQRSLITARPGFAHIWVGDDPATAVFVRVKKNKAQQLNCDYFLHNFPAAGDRQLEALIKGLNVRKDIHGIVLQLPLPKTNNIDRLISLIEQKKDVDGLTPNSAYPAPTPSGVIAILEENKIDPTKMRTVIIGAGRLVGQPLAKMFQERGWTFTHLKNEAEKQAAEIRQHNLVIACTGVPSLITPAMISLETILIDATGVDADVKALEPLVKAISPAKGGIGPLTVSFLFENLLRAAQTVENN